MEVHEGEGERAYTGPNTRLYTHRKRLNNFIRNFMRREDFDVILLFLLTSSLDDAIHRAMMGRRRR